MANGRTKKKTRVSEGGTATEVQKTEVPQMPQNPASIFGEVAWLMMQSPAHKHLFLTDLEWLILPAIQLKQMRVIRNDDNIVGFVSWAFLSKEVEKRLISGNTRLAPADWHSGENLWLIDIVARDGNKKKLIDIVRPQLFKDQAVKTLHPKEDGSGLEAIEL